MTMAGRRRALLLVMLLVPLAPFVAAGGLAPQADGVLWGAGDRPVWQGLPEGSVLEVPAQVPGPLTGRLGDGPAASRDVDGDHIENALDARLDSVVDTEVLSLLVRYDHRPGLAERQALHAAGAEGSRIIMSLNAITTAGTPAQVVQYAAQPGVTLVVERGEIAWFGDIQTRSTQARPSEVYADAAWDLGYQGRNVTMALTDTGVDDEHPSFAGRFVAGVDLTKLEGPDILNPLDEGLFAPRDGSYNPDDEQGHGTSCFGMACGTGAPDLEYVGAAPATRLVDVRIGTELGVGPGEEPIAPQWYDSALEGLDWILQNRETIWDDSQPELAGIDIVSLSWGIYPPDNDPQGSDGTDEYSQMLNELVAQGVHVVNAAGNEGPDNDGLWAMAAAEDSIVVAASDDVNTVDRTDDVIAGYSSRGPRQSDDDGNDYDELIPTIAASGTNIIQAQANTQSQGDASQNGYNGRGSGTSYATPAVAGIVALMLEANPELEPLVVKEILKATAERRGPATFPELDPYWNRDFGWGLVNAHAAVSLAVALQDSTEPLDLLVQAGIDNVSMDDDATTIVGKAWARGGTVDRVEYRVADGEWTEVTYEDDAEPPEAGASFNWTLVLDADQFAVGEHPVEVRAVSETGVGLPLQAMMFGSGPSESASGVPLWAFVVLLIIVVAMIVAFVVTQRQAEENRAPPPGFITDEEMIAIMAARDAASAVDQTATVEAELLDDDV